MEQRVIDGVEIRGLGPCATCGAAPTEAVLQNLVLNYKATADVCSVCGRLIRLTALTPKHLHVPDKEADLHWDISFLEYEKSFNWMTAKMEFTVDIRAHVECSILTMPFADWEGKNACKLPPEDRRVENLEVESPCPKCAKEITPTETRAALDWLFRVHDASCVYCGREISILWATIKHRTWHDEDQCRRWAIDDYRTHFSIEWFGHTNLPGGGFQSLEFRGHYACARQRLPHARWTPPLPRAPWRKQDWSHRIEPWTKGHIEGEAVPDWGTAFHYARRSQEAGKVT